jgi:hypothetical protein
MLRIGRPLPNISARDRVSIGIFERRPPLLPGWRREVTPPTHVVRPPFFVNKSVIYTPLTQQVPTKERMLGGNVTGAELKHVLEANAKALRHGGKPTTLGYGTDWATIQERAAKRLRVKSEQLKAHERDRPAEKDRRRRKWNAMDAAMRKDEPDLTKRDSAKKIAARLGGSWRVIERHIRK